MSSISKYAVLGVGFAFASLQATESGSFAKFVPQETTDQNSVNPSEPTDAQPGEISETNAQQPAVEAPVQNAEIQASEMSQPASASSGLQDSTPSTSETRSDNSQENNYNQSEVLVGDMFSIGAYKSTVHSMKQHCEPKSMSTAVKVEDFTGPTNIEAVSPCDKIVAIPDWDRYSGDSAKTINGWKRWWKYLNLKAPIIMGWVNGLVIRIYPKNEIYRSIFVNGIYDPNMVIVAEKFLPKNGVMIEAGANMGYFSLLISRSLGTEGKIYALEPCKRDFSRLIDNVSINKLSKAISCHNLAVLNKNGTERLTVACEERSALNTMGSAFSFKGVDKVEVENVTTITLDKFAENEGIEHVDVLKLDVEGSEKLALDGAKNLIERFRPVIILGVNRNALAASEQLPEGISKKEREKKEKEKVARIYKDIQKILKDLRYKMYKLNTSPTFELQPVEDLESARTNVVYCLHESIVPPKFEQPQQVSILGKIVKFFKE